MDVQSGLRKILYRCAQLLTGAQLDKDGKNLIYNSEGLLYKYDLSTGSVSKLNTGIANQNNNDHVISFDGKQIALSNHVGEKRISTLFILLLMVRTNQFKLLPPIQAIRIYIVGQLMEKKLIFTGQRKNQYDIWAVDIASKKETQLTNTQHWMIHRSLVQMVNGFILIPLEQER
jgi:Tol biopolymer transport system component